MESFNLLGGLNKLPYSRHSKQEVSTIENFVVRNFQLQRRNGVEKFSDIGIVAGNESDNIYSFSIGSKPYLLHIQTLLGIGNTLSLVFRIIDENGNISTPTSLYKNNLSSQINDYLTIPNGSPTLDKYIQVRQIKDRLYIINKTIDVKFNHDIDNSNGAKDTAHNNHYCLYVKESANPPYSYTVWQDTNSYYKQSSDSDDVATLIAQHWNTQAQSIGSVVEIIAGDGEKWKAHDSFGGQAMSLIKRSTPRYEDLPQHFETNYYVKYYIEHNDGLPYFIVYRFSHILKDWIVDCATRYEPLQSKAMVKETSTANFQTMGNPILYFNLKLTEGNKNGKGYYVEWDSNEWQETAKPTDETIIAEYTMPLQIFQENGTFYIDTMEFSKKSATAPQPPIAGKKIQDMFLLNNRLGFVTDNDISLTSPLEDKKPINLFYTTAKDLIPQDPLFYGISDSRAGEIILTHTTQGGFYIFTTEGIFLSQVTFDKVVGQQPQISKVSNLNVKHAYSSGSKAYFITDSRLYLLDSKGIQEVGQKYRELLKNIIDIAYCIESQETYLLSSDRNTVYCIDISGKLYPLTFPNKQVNAIEVIDNRLVLGVQNGVYAMEIIEDSGVYQDRTPPLDYVSKIALPKNLLGDGKTWLRFFYKRLELFPNNQNFKLISKEYNRDTEDTTSNRGMINGSNFTTDIIIESIDDNPLDIELVNLTIERAK